MKYLTLKELPTSERPYEKCERYGAGVLSDAELLAVILRTGTKNQRAIDLAVNILNYSTAYPGLKGLNYLTLQELKKINGIGRVKAIELLCLNEITKRMAKAVHHEAIQLTTPQSVADYYMQDMRHLTREQVLLLMMDTKSKIIKDMIISEGTINTSIMPTREIFVQALKYEAVNIILIHNHPSGDPTPSTEDIRVTKRISEAGNLVGITLMDHIILGDNKYISLKQQGYI
ncbi:DNA repair protein RadC [Lachnospiraceae bacterium MD1]|jgi:DNA repair protein RadC|uniref:DNA repair protein RadC n=1 Tax=Variimorphobacter saccharofermentans TaxID=2755051 RepID=A0A839K0M9_9FIRM|nr:DNA repair protein RadC [Variimorphobacter saccharofermentans]MBB2182987.1 DNA repair protein RadC [Variimorphobacter saccharofermentans]